MRDKLPINLIEALTDKVLLGIKVRWEASVGIWRRAEARRRRDAETAARR